MSEQTHSVERDRLEDTLEETLEALRELGVNDAEILRRAAAFLADHAA